MVRSSSKTEFVLNVRLLAVTALALVVISVAGYFWHSWQVNWLAESLLNRAAEFEQNGQSADALRYLSQYVQMHPEDANGHMQLAKVFDRANPEAESKLRAIAYYRRAVGAAGGALDGAASDRFDQEEKLRLQNKLRDLRTRLAELLLETAQFSDALTQIDELSSSTPATELKDAPAATVLRIEALAKYEQALRSSAGDWKGVQAAVDKALAQNPGDVKLASSSAEVCRTKLNRAQDADRTMDRLVAANPKSPTALLARHYYKRRYKLPGAEADLAAALQNGPKEPTVLFAAGDQAVNDGRHDEARQRFTAYIETSPSELRGYIGLYTAQLNLKDAKGALETLRTGLTKAPGAEFVLGWRLADLLISQRDFAAADKELVAVQAALQKQRQRFPQSAVEAIQAETDFIRAHWWLEQGKFAPAIQLLEKLSVTNVVRLPGVQHMASRFEAPYLLAQAQMRNGQHDQAAAAFEKVLATAPSTPEAMQFKINVRRDAARAYLALGQLDRATEHLDLIPRAEEPALPSNQAASSSDDPQREVRLLRAQSEFMRQARLSKDQRDWTAFDRELQVVAQRKYTGWQWFLLQAERDALADQKDQAIKSLEAAEKSYAENAECLQALARVYERLGELASADRALDTWSRLPGAMPAALLAKAAALARRGKDAEAYTQLKAAEATLPEPGRSAVRHQLVQLQLRRGERDAARQGLLALSAAQPDNAQWLMELAELSVEAKDLATAEQCEQRLKQLEGEAGTLWRFFRARRLTSSSPTGDPALSEAADLAKQIEAARPAWPWAYLLKGLVAEKQRDSTTAIAAYRRAIELGDRRPATYERLIPLLYLEKRYDEATELLTQVQENQRTSQLSHVEVAVSLQQDDPTRAHHLANAWVARNPEDPLAHIWRAQALIAQQETNPNAVADAEAALTKASELAPQDYRIWDAMLTFFIRHQRPEKARDVVTKIDEKIKLPPAEKAALLGQCFERIGDPVKAKARYQEAAELAPKNTTVQLLRASFLVRTRSPEAAAALDNLEGVVETSETRRVLAALRMNSGDPTGLDQAIAQLSRPEGNAAEVARNDRLRAAALVQRNKAGDRGQAVKILAELISKPEFVIPNDHLALARLLDLGGKTTEAKQHYEVVAISPKSEPPQWLEFADFLLRHHLDLDAAAWIRKLEEKDPQSLSTASLRARLLFAQGKQAEVEAIVKPIAEQIMAKQSTAADQAKCALEVGQLYSQVELLPAALERFREAYRLVPAYYGPLVIALVKSKQIPEAVEICRTAGDSALQPALVLGSALVNSNATKDEIASAERIIDAAMQSHGDRVDLLMCVAALRFLQEQYSEVIEVSRRILAQDPQNVVAMNNLASILAEEKSTLPEALKFVDEALAIAGRTPTLLDTKGTALLYQGRVSEAVELLREATTLDPRDARFQLHLAIAYQTQGDLRKAAEHLKLAYAAKLARGTLTPHERRLLDELSKKVKADPAT